MLESKLYLLDIAVFLPPRITFLARSDKSLVNKYFIKYLLLSHGHTARRDTQKEIWRESEEFTRIGLKQEAMKL